MTPNSCMLFLEKQSLLLGSKQQTCLSILIKLDKYDDVIFTLRGNIHLFL